MRFLKSCRLLLLLGLLPVCLGAANFVFVFHGSLPTISIYNADTLELLGQPSVGGGALKAFGVPDPGNPNQFLKFYVVTLNTIVVLDPLPPFAVRKTLSLSGNVAPGPNSVVLTPDGQRLLVAAGNQVHVVNTNDPAGDAINATLATSSTPGGIAVLPNSKRAYVLLPGLLTIQIVDLTTNPPQVSASFVSIPSSVPSAIGMAPNGFRLYTATPGQIFDIDRISNTPGPAIANSSFSTVTSITFDPDPPVARAVFNAGLTAPILDLVNRTVNVSAFTAGSNNISKVVLPGANRAFLLAGNPGRIFQGFLSLGGAVSAAINPSTLTEYGSGAVDMEALPDGSRIFVAFFSDTRLLRFDPAGSLAPSQVTTPNPPTGLSVISSPAAVANTLDIYGGNNQSGAVSTTFPATLSVRARATNPAFRQTVTFTSSTSGVSFSDPTALTNINGVAETEVQVPVTAAIQVLATMTSGGTTLTQTFNLNGGAPTPTPQTLTKVFGDRQLVLSANNFPAPMVVQGLAGVTLTISFPAPVTSCLGSASPATIITDAAGMASITCIAGAVTANTAVDISVSDSLGNTLSDAFHATIVFNQTDLPTVLSAEETDLPIQGQVRTTLSNVIHLRARKSNGATSGLDAGIVFTSVQDVTLNPSPAVTSTGVASASVAFGCFIGRGSIRATLQAPGLPFVSMPFDTVAGPTAQIFKRQGDGQVGNPGQLLRDQALLVQVTDVCGNAIAGETVTWSVSPSDAAQLENVFARTDTLGRSSVLVRLGNRAGSFTVTASVTTPSASVVTASFTLTVNAVPSRITSVSATSQTVVIGQAVSQPVVVVVQDANGVAVAGVQVTFSVTSGTATLGTLQTTTDSQGRASTTVQAGNALGVITITAAAAGVSQTATFTITVVGRVPVVATIGFVNGASFRVGWVSGSLGTIFGVGLMEGISGVVLADRAPFPTTLRGVRVIIENVDAPIISLVNNQGQEQINIQVPFGIPAGTVTVVIENNGSRATFSGVRVVALNPGIFEFDSGGRRLAAALHADFSVVTQSNPARRGEIILLFLTGLGPTRPPVGTNVAGPIPPAVTVVSPVVGINNAGTQLLGSFYAPTLFTAYQINFVIPADAQSGLAKISVVADGNPSQDSLIPIQ